MVIVHLALIIFLVLMTPLSVIKTLRFSDNLITSVQFKECVNLTDAGKERVA